MSRRTLSRRNLLTASLGLSQMALLERFVGQPRLAHAAGGKKPKRLLTLYVPGGWMPALVSEQATGPQEGSPLQLLKEPATQNWQDPPRCRGVDWTVFLVWELHHYGANATGPEVSGNPLLPGFLTCRQVLTVLKPSRKLN